MQIFTWLSLAAAISIRLPGGLPAPLCQLPPLGQLQLLGYGLGALVRTGASLSTHFEVELKAWHIAGTQNDSADQAASDQKLAFLRVQDAKCFCPLM
eukprot:SAG31_NODE_5593_length_2434_cov_1.981156_1_plen_97_part_00